VEIPSYYAKPDSNTPASALEAEKMLDYADAAGSREMTIPAQPQYRDMKAAKDKASSVAAVGGTYRQAQTAPTLSFPPIYEGNDRFEQVDGNPVKLVSAEPVSTFSSDVDTASYSFVRRMLKEGRMPSGDSVRVEEMINYFDYDYIPADNPRTPFKPNVAIHPTPWNKNTKLLHIGIKGYELDCSQEKNINLVFLIDVSGSMQSNDKLPLVKQSLAMLVNTIDPDDKISIVTYAGCVGVQLEPTKVRDKRKILGVINRLGAGGSTAGAAGIELAYAQAESMYDANRVNRVILASDGDFNVGINDPDKLKKYVAKKRDKGIFLSILGYGQGNYYDEMMQKLAQNGNGNAAYIDSAEEAMKVLVTEARSTLFTIAKDVKFQIEFNPARVSEYRLVGYETRMLNREDFNNDKVDAGDIGAGHTVTAIYEIVEPGSSARLYDDLRYAVEKPSEDYACLGNEYGMLKMRYKLPDEDVSTLVTYPITNKDEFTALAKTPDDLRFAASVAAFGQILKGGKYTDGYDLQDVESLAKGARGKDEFGYRAEFVRLVKLARTNESITGMR
jgi:Ca-activated chloride channel family protein